MAYKTKMGVRHLQALSELIYFKIFHGRTDKVICRGFAHKNDNAKLNQIGKGVEINAIRPS